MKQNSKKSLDKILSVVVDLAWKQSTASLFRVTASLMDLGVAGVGVGVS